MMKIPDSITRHWKIIEELETQTDRGVAIIGAEYLNERLGTALRKTFTEGIEERFFSSFYAKIEIAFAMGFYGEKTLKDLHCIRKIRNKFAHTVEPVNFETPEISKICNELWYSKNCLALGKSELPIETKEMFLDTLFTIYNLLWTEMIKKDLVGNNRAEKPKPHIMP